MSAKILITTLILGMSSVASAHPSATISADASFDASFSPSSVRDHRHNVRYDQRVRYDRASRYHYGYEVYPRQPVARWMDLGTFDAQADRTQIEFDARHAPMNQLFLRQNGWKSRLFNIEIIYANGRSTNLPMDRYLGDVANVGTMTMTVDLPRAQAPISRIIVTASNARGSSFTVYGR